MAEEVDSTKKYVELIEYMEVEDQIRIQLKCHAPNELFDKLYSCLYQKEGKRYVLKSKFIDET